MHRVGPQRAKEWWRTGGEYTEGDPEANGSRPELVVGLRATSIVCTSGGLVLLAGKVQAASSGGNNG